MSIDIFSHAMRLFIYSIYQKLVSTLLDMLIWKDKYKFFLFNMFIRLILAKLIFYNTI